MSALLCMFSLLGINAYAAQAPQDSTVVKGDLGRQIDQIVQRWTECGFWGRVLVAKGSDILLAKGYGYADYVSRPNTPLTVFEIASTSKQFTAAAILKLEMQGKLTIQDSITKYFNDVPVEKRGITLLPIYALSG